MHVHLGFEYGHLMRDDAGLLEGTGVTRRVRWVTLRKRDSIPDSQLERLVLEGLAVALLSHVERIGRMLDMETE